MAEVDELAEDEEEGRGVHLEGTKNGERDVLIEEKEGAMGKQIISQL